LENVQHEYETVVIIRPDLDDADTYAIVERLEAAIAENGGALLIRDDWGKRKLAYPIEKHQKGHYVLLNYIAPASLVTELERRTRIIDTVIRFLTVKQVEAVDVELRMSQAEEERRIREERARARAAE